MVQFFKSKEWGAESVLKPITFLVLVLLAGGCAKVNNLPQLLTLKDLAGQQALTDRAVDETDRLFAALLKAYKENGLKDYTDQEGIVRDFGQPIAKKDMPNDDTVVQRWYYRYSVKFFDSDVIFLYFDDQGKLIDKQLIEYHKAKSQKPK